MCHLTKKSSKKYKQTTNKQKQLIKKLKDDISKRPAAPAAGAAAASEPAAAEPKEQKEKINVSPIDSGYGGSVRAGGGALGKKEAAIEEKYFRDQDKEKLEKLKKK
ncbi:hypothetical protein HDU76_012164 [Blyttiomyces sp. JEL0837]|nr:hypothetical protein HDU76_012164 [Blyttiomyces sp. JEL0837]